MAKAVTNHGHGEPFFEGDMVWVLNPNPRRNKLQACYEGPYYITRFVGEQRQAVELSMDGRRRIIRNIEQICQYHRAGRFGSGDSSPQPPVAESSGAAEARLSQDRGVYPEPPLQWNEAVAPEARF